MMSLKLDQFWLWLLFISIFRPVNSALATEEKVARLLGSAKPTTPLTKTQSNPKSYAGIPTHQSSETEKLVGSPNPGSPKVAVLIKKFEQLIQAHEDSILPTILRSSTKKPKSRNLHQVPALQLQKPNKFKFFISDWLQHNNGNMNQLKDFQVHTLASYLTADDRILSSKLVWESSDKLPASPRVEFTKVDEVAPSVFRSGVSTLVPPSSVKLGQPMYNNQLKIQIITDLFFKRFHKMKQGLTSMGNLQIDVSEFFNKILNVIDQFMEIPKQNYKKPMIQISSPHIPTYPEKNDIFLTPKDSFHPFPKGVRQNTVIAIDLYLHPEVLAILSNLLKQFKHDGMKGLIGFLYETKFPFSARSSTMTHKPILLKTQRPIPKKIEENGRYVYSLWKTTPIVSILKVMSDGSDASKKFISNIFHDNIKSISKSANKLKWWISPLVPQIWNTAILRAHSLIQAVPTVKQHLNNKIYLGLAERLGPKLLTYKNPDVVVKPKAMRKKLMTNPPTNEEVFNQQNDLMKNKLNEEYQNKDEEKETQDEINKDEKINGNQKEIEINKDEKINGNQKQIEIAKDDEHAKTIHQPPAENSPKELNLPEEEIKPLLETNSPNKSNFKSNWWIRSKNAILLVFKTIRNTLNLDHLRRTSTPIL